mgnify:FL=1
MSTIQASSAITLPQLSMAHQSSQLQITQLFQLSLKQSSVWVIQHALHILIFAVTHVVCMDSCGARHLYRNTRPCMSLYP